MLMQSTATEGVPQQQQLLPLRAPARHRQVVHYPGMLSEEVKDGVVFAIFVDVAKRTLVIEDSTQ